jgi:hypothetical protein
MNRAALVGAAFGASLLGVGWALRRQQRCDDHWEHIESSTVIPIITPTIEIPTAEYVLSRMERMPLDDVTLVLHTEGGCVTSCVMIADALRKFARSTAVVPYMAISGGTLIALNAKTLAMGRHAALSAVDPQIFGQRARHIPEDNEDGFYPLAQEYDSAVSSFLRETLQQRLERSAPGSLDRAMEVFMGENAPHAWPIKASDLQRLGLPVEAAGREWARFVDSYRQAIDARPELALRVGRCRR